MKKVIVLVVFLLIVSMSVSAEDLLTQAESAFQTALVTRNPDTIMRLLRNDFNLGGRFFRLSHSERNEFINKGITEVGRILVRNKDVDVVAIPFGRNANAFERTIIYHEESLSIAQFIDRTTLLVWHRAPSNNILFLLQNVPNVQIIRECPMSQMGPAFIIWDVFLRYVGVTPLRMTDGSTRQVATFDVLFHLPLHLRRE